MKTDKIAIFKTNKYLFQSYLLTVIQRLKDEHQSNLLDNLLEKLTLKLIDLSSILIDNKKTKSIYRITRKDCENKEILKQVTSILKKSINESNEQELLESIDQLQTVYVFQSQETTKPNLIRSFFSYIKHKFISYPIENKPIEKYSLMMLKLIESIAADLIAELNIAEHETILIKSDDINYLTQLYDKISRIDDKLNENEQINTSFLNQILAENNLDSCQKRTRSRSTSQTSDSSVEVYKKIRSESESSTESVQSVRNKTMLKMSVKKLPGVGHIYAERLKEKNINNFSDLIYLYEINCHRDDLIFENKLKSLASIKSNSIKQIIEIIKKNL